MTDVNKDDLLHAYRQMKTIREFEERLHLEIQKGQVAGFTHLYSGQEAVAVGVCETLTDRDYIASTHRGHGHWRLEEDGFPTKRLDYQIT